MKKWLIRFFILAAAVATLLCCMGMDVNCDGEFQGLNCSINGCDSECNHSYKLIEETQSTCGEAGYTKYECRKCGHVDTQYKSKPDHNITNTIHRGDCSKGGDYGWYEQETCSNCDYSKKNIYFNGYAVHLYDEGKITYYEDGSGCGEITYTCLICNGTKISLYHSADSPQMQDYNTSYENKQCSTYLKTCELCNKTVTYTWHKNYTEDVLVEPTATDYGLAEYRCTQTNSGSSQHCLFIGWLWYVVIPPTGE